MARFKGQAEYSVDSKGRVAIPAKMRNALSPEANQTFTLTKGFEKCIYLYPLDEWKVREEQFAALNTYQKEARHLVRMILMWAEEVSLDGQGRVSLPKALAEYAGIGEKALIIGAMERIELWDPDAFARYLEESPTDPEELAERVMGSG
ncbi:MAG: division/cell wall cluster transcriptional repressor MraZ [Rhodothermales bacterium]